MDLIEQAEALCDMSCRGGQTARVRDQIYAKRYIQMCDLVPQLVAEIKRLRSMPPKIHLAHDPIGPVTLNGIEYVPRGELAAWQKIAIDLKASAIQDANSGDFVDSWGNHMFQVVDIEKCREQAAKELGLQVKQEAVYLERLERLALSMCIEAGWGQEDVEAALEKIRRDR